MENLENDKLVKLSILQYYDKNIKEWVLRKLSSIAISSNIIFLKKEDFPKNGQLETLYIDTNTFDFYIWDTKNSQYQNITLTEGENFETATAEEILSFLSE